MLRFDSSPIPATTSRTPSGGLRIPATIARTGCQTYLLPDGSERIEYRPLEEVSSPEAIGSFRGAPVTDGHPRETVSPSSWRTLSRGHVGDDVRVENNFMEASVYVLDDRTIQRVLDRALVEVSCGYEVEIDLTPGTTPDGLRYDAVQRQIRGNHIALLPAGTGRAGRDVRLRLDAAGNSTQETTMKVKVNGVEYDAIGESLQGAVDQVQAEVERQRARADAAEGARAKLETDLAQANDPKRIDALVDARTDLVDAVRRLDSTVVCAGRSEEDILREVAGKVVKLDGSEPLAFLRGVLAVTKTTSRRADVEEIKTTTTQPKPRARWTPAPLAANREGV
jgi:hypothetical protein